MSRSVIWTAFGNDGAAANDDTAQCKLCMKEVKHSGNTKNLWQHYERHHKDEYNKKTDGYGKGTSVSRFKGKGYLSWSETKQYF